MYLITNTSLCDSLYVDGIRIPSQKARLFEVIKPLTLAVLKRDPNAQIQLVSKPESLVNETKLVVCKTPEIKHTKKCEENQTSAKVTKMENTTTKNKND